MLISISDLVFAMPCFPSKSGIQKQIVLDAKFEPAKHLSKILIMIHVLIIHKNYPVIKAMKKTLRREKDISIVYQTTSNSEADQILETSHSEIDIILIDICQNETGSLHYISYIRRAFPEIKILVFSFHHSGARVYHMYKGGIHGFLYKDSGPAEIVKAIRTIYNGNFYYEGKVKSTLENYSTYLDYKTDKQIYISPKELEYIRNLAQSFSLETSFPQRKQERLIDQRIWNNISLKLGTSNPQSIVEIAYQKGWIQH